MGITEYKETVDYSWVLARQLDRAAEALSRVPGEAPGLAVPRVAAALEALVALAWPFLGDPEAILREVARAREEARQGRPRAALRLILRLLSSIVSELEEKGLLVRRRDLMGAIEE